MEAQYTDPCTYIGVLYWEVHRQDVLGGAWDNSWWLTFNQQWYDCCWLPDGGWGYHYNTTVPTGKYAYYAVAYDSGWTVSGDCLESKCGTGGSPGLLGFTVRETPAAPTLGSPTSSQTVSTTQPILTASSSEVDGEPDAIYYRFEIATDSGFGSLIGDFSWLPSGNMPLPSTWTYGSAAENLSYGATYYWRAQAADAGDGTSDWSTGQPFTVAAKPDLGTSANWPMWSSGPVAVNEATGNLFLSAPTPSFPTAAGSLGVAVSYNSRDGGTDRGLGPNWTVGPDGAVRLIDHKLVPSDGLDAIEQVLSDGSSVFYQHTGSNSSVYLPTDGGSSQLTKNPDNSYTLVDDDASVYSFGTADGSGGRAADERPVAVFERGCGSGRLRLQRRRETGLGGGRGRLHADRDSGLDLGLPGSGALH